MSLNKVMLIGNVGLDPEVRYLDGSNSGAKVATLRLATTERYRDRNTGETRELTEWHTVVAWRSLADIIEKYVKKGTQLYIEGRIRTRSWDDKDGNKRYTTEIQADNLQLLGRRADNPGATDQPAPAATPQYQPAAPAAPAAPQYQAPAAPASPAAPAVPESDDDLPF